MDSKLETIVWYALIFATLAGLIFTHGIVDNLFHQWRQRRNTKEKTETENHPVVTKPVQRTVDTKPFVRGYDSPDLFREDALIHIRELERKIDRDLNKGK